MNLGITVGNGSLLGLIDPQPITSGSVTATAFAAFGSLLIPATACFREDRVEPLIQHEVGTQPSWHFFADVHRETSAVDDQRAGDPAA